MEIGGRHLASAHEEFSLGRDEGHVAFSHDC